jgi:peptidoglycan/LPS O-acetylase OafA/YrhL
MTNTPEADRIPELDGVRGLAIFLVLAHHILPMASYLTQNEFLRGFGRASEIGWVGVDVFFVLSGYLITGILLRSRQHPNYFKNFYARRILRIFPLYYLVTGAILLFLPTLEKNNPAYTQSLWYVFALYLQNWLYLLPLPVSQAPAHTWSLAIEEQFYLVFPAIAYKLNPQQLLRFSLGVITFMPLFRLALILLNVKALGFPTGGFFYLGTFTRFENFAFGALLALAAEHFPRLHSALQKYAPAILTFSLPLFLLTALSQADARETSPWLQSIGYSLLAAATAALILLLTSRPAPNLLRRFFRLPPLTFLGKYSYGIYLLHAPLVTLLIEWMMKLHRQSGQMWLAYILATFFGSLLLAYLSWHGMEKHLLKLKRYFV